jgi:hypothetical protein
MMARTHQTGKKQTPKPMTADDNFLGNAMKSSNMTSQKTDTAPKKAESASKSKTYVVSLEFLKNNWFTLLEKHMKRKDHQAKLGRRHRTQLTTKT